MEIRFSKNLDVPLWRAIENAAGQHGIAPSFTSANGYSFRFRLLDADQDDHDKVIRSLLELDPDATVRTARAIYEGRSDFEAQVKTRV